MTRKAPDKDRPPFRIGGEVLLERTGGGTHTARLPRLEFGETSRYFHVIDRAVAVMFYVLLNEKISSAHLIREQRICIRHPGRHQWIIRRMNREHRTREAPSGRVVSVEIPGRARIRRVTLDAIV